MSRRERAAIVRSSAGFLPFLCSHRFTIQTLSPMLYCGEVDDPVIALGDALLVERGKHYR